MKLTNDVVVVAYGRSPVTRANKGVLKNLAPVELGAQVLRGVLNRVPKLKADMIDDVIIGCAYPEESQGFNLGQIVAKKAGLPETVPGQTVNRFCSSGLQSLAHGANAIMSGQYDVAITGGIECSSWVAMTVVDLSSLDMNLFKNNPAVYTPMGLTAEFVVEKAKEKLNIEITREAMDTFAVESHKRAARAQKNGEFKKEIIPVQYIDENGEMQTLFEDDGIREDSTVEALSQLNACFKEGGTVTAANSSPMNDGAAFQVLMSRKKAKELGIKPIAKFIGYNVGGTHPAVMGIGPLFAIPKLLKRKLIPPKRFDVVELNEAFAAQSIPCIEKVGLNPEKVNPRGGAIALGHPLGATGAILTCRMLSYLEDTQGKLGMVTMCIGGGMGAAGAFKRL